MHFTLPLSLLIFLEFSPLIIAQSSSASVTPTLSNVSRSGSITASATSSSASSTATNTAVFPDLSHYSACATNCLALSVSNCASLIDVDCYCVSKNFTSSLLKCVTKTCPTDLASAESLAQDFCNLAATSTSLSFPHISTVSASVNSSSTAPVSSSVTLSGTTLVVPVTTVVTTTATASATGSNAATMQREGGWFGAAIGLAVAGLFI